MQTTKPKRYLWLLSTVLPLIAMTGVWLFERFQMTWLLAMPLLFIYLVIPLLDLVFSTDESNPDEHQVEQLEKDPYYNWVLYLMLPFHFYVLYSLVAYLVNHQLGFWSEAWVIMTLGVFGGLAVNLGHELGHKKDRVSRNLAKLALASGAYGHFNIEHNAGHHREVATPEDTASARFGESIYRFVFREYPGGIKRAWLIEKNRLARKGQAWYSLDNQILHSYAMTLLIYGLMTYWFGWQALLILLIHAPIVWWQLTSANYIEHYGLLRDKDSQGKYEKCQPKHSWNSNHLVSNLVLFHLQRHSDHHANPARHYQSLRHFDDAPQLPTGYMGMFILAYFPPLWFSVMNKKLMNMHQNDMKLINH